MVAMLGLQGSILAEAAREPLPAAERDTRGRVIHADPTNYLRWLRSLKPGDTLVLAAGTYDHPHGAQGLPIFNLHGTAAAPITITGPDEGPRPRFLGRVKQNTVRIANASHVIVRNLDIDGRNLGGDGVNGQGPSHHITLEQLSIRGVGGYQSTVGISTNRAPVWNWIIRRNTIVGAGTGMYLGNSNGANPFVAGVIEHNLIRDTLGYNLQVKHQVPWPEGAGLPADTTWTVIRHNVFSKGGASSNGPLARPNVLVGDVPPWGPGKDNGYRIYGNFFYQNPTEVLFQGEGNVAFYSNLLVNDAGGGVVMQRHNGALREAQVFGNTIVASGAGIVIRDADPAYAQRAVANAVFAGETPIMAPEAWANLTDSYENAMRFLVNPRGPLSDLDLHPLRGKAKGAAIDAKAFGALPGASLDFDSQPRDWSYRGAYAGEGDDRGWQPRLEIKP